MATALLVLAAGVGFGVLVAVIGCIFALAMAAADAVSYKMGTAHFVTYALVLGVGFGAVGALIAFAVQVSA